MSMGGLRHGSMLRRNMVFRRALGNSADARMSRAKAHRFRSVLLSSPRRQRRSRALHELAQLSRRGTSLKQGENVERCQPFRRSRSRWRRQAAHAGDLAAYCGNAGACEVPISCFSVDEASFYNARELPDREAVSRRGCPRVEAAASCTSHGFGGLLRAR
jgi:hypothetical protein